MDSEEVIRRKMEQTRESLTEKIDTLENKVLGSVEEATSAVKETVLGVKESVQEGMETVKDAVDIKGHVDRHPWYMLGGAVLCGYVLSSLVRSEKQGTRSREPPPAPPPAQEHRGNGRPAAEKQPAANGSDWLGMLEPELNKLKGLALGAALGTVRELLVAEAPPHMGEQLRQIIDGITAKVGGEPVPSSDWLPPASAQEKANYETTCSEVGAEKPRW